MGQEFEITELILLKIIPILSEIEKQGGVL